LPFDIEGVSLTSATWVVDADHGTAASIARRAYQLLAAAAIDSPKPEIDWSGRHDLIALKTPPGSGLAASGSQIAYTALDLDGGRPVDFDFDGALPISAASGDIGAPGLGNGSGRQDGGHQNRKSNANSVAHWASPITSTRSLDLRVGTLHFSRYA
jgi:hypothetical protein